MSPRTASTRRSFLKVGALAAAPVAAAVPVAAMADQAQKARLAQFEDEAAIRALHRSWLGRVNAGEDASALFVDPAGARLDQAVRSLAGDHAGGPDSIEIAPDGRRAAGRFACAAELQTAIAQDCTLAQMAHAQGGGLVRRTERRVLEIDYLKVGDGWAMTKVELAPA